MLFFLSCLLSFFLFFLSFFLLLGVAAIILLISMLLLCSICVFLPLAIMSYCIFTARNDVLCTSSFFLLFNVCTHYGDITRILIIILSMFDNDKIRALLQLRCTYTRKCICTNTHSINIHSCTIPISGPIGLFIDEWANGTKYCGLYRTSDCLIDWLIDCFKSS